MKDLSLSDLFGKLATQDYQQVTTRKSDRPLLTISLNNRAESLLVADLLKALDNFQGDLQDHNLVTLQDHEGYPLGYDYTEDYEKLSISRWSRKFIVKFGLIFVQDTIVVNIFTPYLEDEDFVFSPDKLDY
jgi:hypothetical protein